MMLRSILYRAALAFCLMSSAAAAATDDLHHKVVLLWAEMHFVQEHCPSLSVNLPLVDAFSDRVLGRGGNEVAVLTDAYEDHSTSIARAVDRDGLDVICDRMFGTWNSTIVGSDPLVTMRPVKSLSGFEEFKSHYGFDLSVLSEHDRSIAEAALSVIYQLCDGLTVHMDHLTFERVDVFEPWEPIDFTGSAEPWRRFLQFYFVAEITDEVPLLWNGHRFGIYINDETHELTAEKHVGHQACGMSQPADGSNLVRKFEWSSL